MATAQGVSNLVGLLPIVLDCRPNWERKCVGLEAQKKEEHETRKWWGVGGRPRRTVLTLVAIKKKGGDDHSWEISGNERGEQLKKKNETQMHIYFVGLL